MSEGRLNGGNLSAFVTRVGDTVRRPTGPWTPAVHALLRHLAASGFRGAPKVLGIDDDGREVLEFVPGVTASGEAHHRLLGSDRALGRAAGLVRAFHDAVVGFTAPRTALPASVWRFPEMEADSLPWAGDGPTIICHNDLGGWNLVCGAERWAFVDWDTAGPRPAIWDVAYAAAAMVPIQPDVAPLGWPAPPDIRRRLDVFADGYGLSDADRARVPDVIVARLRSSCEHMRRRAEAGIAPWDRLWSGPHGAAWMARVRFAEARAAGWTP